MESSVPPRSLIKLLGEFLYKVDTQWKKLLPVLAVHFMQSHGHGDLRHYLLLKIIQQLAVNKTPIYMVVL